MNDPIVIVSTGFNVPEKAKFLHFKTIREQTHPIERHIYIDGAKDRSSAMQNLYHAVSPLPPKTIVLSIDADDWLASPRSVERVIRAYEKDGAWMTWGSFMVHTKGGRQYNQNATFDVKDRSQCRKLPWFASHMKTFRAGLFQQIKRDDLLSPFVSPDPNQQGTGWVTDCTDLALMFPMLEMSAERGVFIKERVYIYNFTNPLSVHNAPKWRKDFQKKEGARIRAMQPYERLKERPW